MPELRHDPVTKRWVIIATDRSRRPIDFTSERASLESLTFNPFEEGNEDKTPPEIFAIRDKGTKPNTPGWNVRVVPNKFPALRIEGDLDREGLGLYDRMNGVGAHEVIIESPEFGDTMDKMSQKQLTFVLQTYRQRLNDLKNDSRFKYALIFKNHGADAGATLAHPHSQLIATPITPKAVAEELDSAKEHYYVKQRCLFCDLMKQELKEESRIVMANDKFVVYCPYASRFPFELMLIPRKHNHDFGSSDDQTLESMAATLSQTMKRLSAALDDPPYNFMLHTSPNVHGTHHRPSYWQTLPNDWHWHLEITPRVTRMAGFEWGTDFFINPVAPENAAQFIRDIKLLKAEENG
jgi:UDPglucose--hexose-1-phosphate uridylyltransferase